MLPTHFGQELRVSLSSISTFFGEQSQCVRPFSILNL